MRVDSIAIDAGDFARWVLVGIVVLADASLFCGEVLCSIVEKILKNSVVSLRKERIT